MKFQDIPLVNKIKNRLNSDEESSVMYLHAAVAIIGSLTILLTLEYEVLNLSEANHAFIVLIEKTCVIIVLAYVVTRLKFFTEILDKKFTLKNQALMILVFGLISIFGTYTGIDIFGAQANVRDLGPMVAGLVGGPVVGVGAALIGSIHRLTLGGFTAVPCALSTLLAGLFAGLIYKFNNGKFIGVLGAVIFAILMESLHLLLALLIATPYSQALEVVEVLSGPIIFANAMGMLVFAIMISNLLKERKTARERDEYFDELERKKHELEVADKIQHSFLPDDIPLKEELDVGVLHIPSKDFDGDFFDFTRISDSKIGLTMADVSGDRIPATILMALSKTIIRNEANNQKNPENLLNYLNKLISPDISAEIKLTILYGILDLKKKILTYVNASHTPPILISSSENKIQELNQDSELLGQMRNLVLNTYKIQLKKGDKLILYNDGIPHIFGQNVDEGKENFMKIIEKNKNLSPSELVKTIENEIDNIKSNYPFDDYIIIVILKF
jgi:sigma-B regulation protein RsbU (phosphoserine phosphatase)